MISLKLIIVFCLSLYWFFWLSKIFAVIYIQCHQFIYVAFFSRITKIVKISLKPFTILHPGNGDAEEEEALHSTVWDHTSEEAKHLLQVKNIFGRKNEKATMFRTRNMLHCLQIKVYFTRIKTTNSKLCTTLLSSANTVSFFILTILVKYNCNFFKCQLKSMQLVLCFYIPEYKYIK